MQMPDIEKLEKIWKTSNRLALLGSFIVCGIFWIIHQNLKCPSLYSFILSIIVAGISTYIWLYRSAIIKGCYSKCPEILPFVSGVVPTQNVITTDDGQILKTENYLQWLREPDNYKRRFTQAEIDKSFLKIADIDECIFITGQSKIDDFIRDLYIAVKGKQSYSSNLRSRFTTWIIAMIFSIIFLTRTFPEIDGKCIYPPPSNSGTDFGGFGGR